jgi:hypothetical protein
VVESGGWKIRMWKIDQNARWTGQPLNSNLCFKKHYHCRNCGKVALFIGATQAALEVTVDIGKLVKI